MGSQNPHRGTLGLVEVYLKKEHTSNMWLHVDSHEFQKVQVNDG